METDEFAVGHFTLSNAKTIHAPIIQEAFINMECTLKETQDLSGAGIAAMVIGQVQHISVEKEYTQGYEQRYGKDGFMMLIPAPQNLVTGEPNQSAIATVKIERLDQKMGKLQEIPGVGKNIEQDLINIGIREISDLKGKKPEELYLQDCLYKGFQEDKCQLYVFRLAVYFAEHETHEAEKLKWWYWKDKEYPDKE